MANTSTTRFTNITRIDKADFDPDAGTSSHIIYGTVNNWDTSFNFTDDDESGTFDVGPFYAQTTYTTTDNQDASVEATLTITYSVPTSATYSTSNATTTSATYPSTTSTTTTATVLSSADGSLTVTVTQNTEYTVGPNAITNTVVVADTTDWLWSLTASGTDLASAIGISFTRTTVSASQTSSAIPVTVVSYNDDTGDPPYETPTQYTDTYFDTSSTTSTTTTTVDSAYQTGATTTDGAFIPLPGSGGATVNYVTSTSTEFTYNVSSTTSYDTYQPLYSDRSYSQDYVTTGSAGTYLTTTELTQRIFYNVYLAVSGASYGQSITIAEYSVGLSYNIPAESNGPPAFIFSELLPGAGFQTPSSMGYGNPVGTNVAGGDIPVSWGSAYPGIAAPLLSPISGRVTDGTDVITTQYIASDSAIFTTRTSAVGTSISSYTGSFSMSIQSAMNTSTRSAIKTQDGSTIGGYGWYTGTDSFTTLSNSSAAFSGTYISTTYDIDTTDTYTSEFSTSTTFSWGAHRFTIQDSTNGTSTTSVLWTDSLTTYSIRRSEGLAFEPLSVAHGSDRTIAFPAYPGN